MSLKNLLALQNKAASHAASVKPAAGTKPPVTAAALEAESPKAEGAGPATPAPEKPKGLGLNLAGAKPSGLSKPAAKPVAPEVIDSDTFSLSDLAATSAESISTPEPVKYSDFEFDDEIEATAPDRELDPDLTQGQLEFIESLDAIYGILHDAEMFGQTVRIIMTELQENEEYKKLLSDSDVHVMIRGMRRTMGLARVRKQEKSRKTNTNKSAQKKAAVSDDAMALLNQLMGGSDD